MSHNIRDKDAYKRPVFSTKNKVKRFIWQFAWLILCRFTPIPFHNWRCFVIRIFGGKIGVNNYIYPTCKIWAPWLLETKEVVTIGSGVEIYNPGGVFLGHHAILSQDAFICGATHDYNTINFTYLMRKITIMPYAWICAKAMVLPGITCGEGSVLAAGAIAKKDLEQWTVYAGNPAEQIKKRNNFLKQQQQHI